MHQTVIHLRRAALQILTRAAFVITLALLPRPATSEAQSAPCSFDDRPCLTQLYSDIMIAALQNDDERPEYLGRDFARHTEHWPALHVETVLSAAALASLDAAFLESYLQENQRLQATGSFTFDGIKTALNRQGWPEGLTWHTFIAKAVIETLYNSDQGQALLELWMQEQAFFEEYAPLGSVEIMEWGLINRPTETVQYLHSEQADPRVAMRGLARVAFAAEELCRQGSKSDADGVIEAYHRFAATQRYDGNAAFLPLKHAFLSLCTAKTHRRQSKPSPRWKSW